MSFGIRIGIAQFIGNSQPQIIIGGGAPASSGRITANGNQRITANGNIRIPAGG